MLPAMSFDLFAIVTLTSGVALRVVLCHAHNAGAEVYPVLVVHDTDDFTRPETGESVSREPVEVDSPYLIGVIGLRALP